VLLNRDPLAELDDVAPNSPPEDEGAEARVLDPPLVEPNKPAVELPRVDEP
jgi:hypothetical protein